MACRFCGCVRGGLTDASGGRNWPEPNRCPSCAGKADVSPERAEGMADKVVKHVDGGQKGFADAADMDEDSRIAVIAESVRRLPGKRVVFVVDDDAKADRYMEKLRRALPEIREASRGQ